MCLAGGQSGFQAHSLTHAQSAWKRGTWEEDGSLPTLLPQWRPGVLRWCRRGRLLAGSDVLVGVIRGSSSYDMFTVALSTVLSATVR